MIRLIQIELHKLLRNNVSKILIFASFILPFTFLILSSIKINFLGYFTLELGELGIFNFPIIWHVSTYFAAFFKFFFAIVIVSMIGNEYSNKTIKQNLIDGLSKKEFLLSKFYTIVFFSLVATVLLGIGSLVIGSIYSSYGGFTVMVREMEFLLAYFVKLIGFFSLCLFFGILVKKSAFALGFLLLLQILEGIGYGMMRWKLARETADFLQNLFPLHAMYKLIDDPIRRLAKMKVTDNEFLNYDYGVHAHEIAIVLGWTLIFTYFSYRLLKRRDL